MKGILFQPWKIKFIAEHTDMEIQTRRLGGLKEINEYPDEWICKGQLQDGKWWFQHPQCERDDWLYNRYIRPPYQVGETVYVKEAWAEWINTSEHLASGVISLEEAKDSVIYKLGNFGDKGWDKQTKENGNPWLRKSVMMMPEWATRYFIKILANKAERLTLPLSPEELAMEGGEQALTILEKINGLWVFAYGFKLIEQ